MKKLNLPCADIWIESDSETLNFELIDVTKSVTKLIQNENQNYAIEKSYILKPDLPDQFNYQNLGLNLDTNLTEKNCEDILSDTWYVGGNWFIDNKVVCVVAYVNNGTLEKHTKVNWNKLPHYVDIFYDFKQELIFQITYKSQEAFFNIDQNKIDLSLDFASDQMYYYLNS